MTEIQQSDHGLTNAELEALPIGARLHYTNWPGKPSIPVTLVGRRSRVRTDAGADVDAFADELSREPRSGLGA